jgi:hypothetical protein
MAIHIDLIGRESRDGIVVETLSPVCTTYQLQCHACGYSSTDPILSARRCPKCGSSSWDRSPVPGALAPHKDRCSGADRRQLVHFRVHYPGAQLYVFADFSGSSQLIPMHEEAQQDWSLSLRLLPGKYHYRFYVDDGTRLTWFAPHHPNEPKTACIDETLIVVEPDAHAAL